MIPDRNFLLICVRKREFVIFDVFMVGTLKTAVFWNVTLCTVIIRVYDGRSRTLYNVGTIAPNNTVFCKEPMMIVSRKWNCIEVTYTTDD
jgi:hypothetical protein